MKVLLINVSLRPGAKQIYFPIGLGYIATAISRSRHDLEILDLELEQLDEKGLKAYLNTHSYDVVALGCIVTGYGTVKKMCNIIRQCGDVPIVVGNTVASSIHEELLLNTEADIAVLGEGDVTIVELLDGLEKGISLSEVLGIAYKEDDNIIVTPNRPLIPSLDVHHSIDWDLFQIETYLERSKDTVSKPYPRPHDRLRAMPINTARGCPYKCTFCYHAFFGKPYRTRSAEAIVNEIKFMSERYGVNYIHFWDELTFHSKKHCRHFVETLLAAELDLHWSAVCRSDLFAPGDEDLVALMTSSGCLGLGYSLESADPKILAAMNKKLKPEAFVAQTKVLQSGGLECWTSLVIGHPLETEESIHLTFETCRQSRVYPSTGYLLPFPGTVIYEEARKNGSITNVEQFLLSLGDRQDLHINLTSMSDEVLIDRTMREVKKTAYELGIDLPPDKLVKTGVYRGAKRV